ncbi:AarF/ABC1/UbiB kinase family protein [Rapidithrix thailandica]|uniref:AarF/ABC1/UbiB kinase family protein n=1 Tax=Rapidithrix thailandica TaxID=413964 RepID=A0AAW9SCQ8_9BACT
MKEENKTQQSIPATKVQRAMKFVTTGAKVGKNYMKHYAKKIVDPKVSRENLHEDNANDIYEALSELKGSALKVAQMMSMDKNLLPRAYANKFQRSQYSAPPLSYPLVVKTFQKHFGKSPSEMFDTFTQEAVNAASIGQVHQATLQGKKLAVKVQYPGVADSVRSDLKMVRPFASRLLRVNEKDVDYYMDEVESMLLSETDYDLELQRSIKLSQTCMASIANVSFPTYYPEYSSTKVLTMDWLEGKHIDQFMADNPSQERCNQIGQALWDFYNFQVHELREVHADPHPGNFILQDNGTLGIIDFGCVKEIPDEFYYRYFPMINIHILEHPEKLQKIFQDLNFIYPDDTAEEKKQLEAIFIQMIKLLGKPFHNGTFDFGDEGYFNEVYAFGEATSDTPILKNSKKARGSKHGLYVNRTYFGLYHLLHQLKAQVNTQANWYEDILDHV